MDKKVSIIVPIYNVEMYLRECLDSIKKQTLRELEIICVNDGSTDNSLSIINEYAADDDRFVIVDGPNGGYGKAMNKGLEAATGEYIGIVEPDDFVKLDMYEDLYKIACDNNLDFVKADFYRFYTDEETEDRTLVYNHLDSTKKYYNRVLNPSEEPGCTKLIINTWSGIYKREFIDKYTIRHNETPGASFQDNGFYWQTMINAERVMFIDKPYYRNRRDNPNSSVNSAEKVYVMNEETHYIEAIIKKQPKKWDIFKKWFVYRKYCNYHFTLYRIANGFRREYLNKFREEMQADEKAGLIDKNIFAPTDYERLLFILKDPEGFYYKEVIRCMNLELENTKSYKLGNALLKLPIMIKAAISSRK